MQALAFPANAPNITRTAFSVAESRVRAGLTAQSGTPLMMCLRFCPAPRLGLRACRAARMTAITCIHLHYWLQLQETEAFFDASRTSAYLLVRPWAPGNRGGCGRRTLGATWLGWQQPALQLWPLVTYRARSATQLPGLAERDLLPPGALSGQAVRRRSSVRPGQQQELGPDTSRAGEVYTGDRLGKVGPWAGCTSSCAWCTGCTYSPSLRPTHEGETGGGLL